MRLKCLFCKYKAVCIPEQESNLTKYHKLKMEYKNLYNEYIEISNLLANKSEDFDDLFVKYENLKYNLQLFIRENDKH